MANEITVPASKAINPSQIDQNPIDPRQGGSRVLKPMERIGVPGYAITNGYVLPFEDDGRLSGQQRYKLFSENLVNVSIIGAGVRYFLDMIAGAGWSFEPADDSREAEETAELFQSIFDDMETGHGRVMRRAAMHKFYGFSVQEWTAKPREDGYIGIADIEPRPQRTIERWDVADNGWIKGVIQRNANNGAEIYIPREKLLYVVDDSLSDSPEGLGLFRHMVRGAAGLKRFEDLEVWGFETDLQGIPVGRVPLAELDEAVANGIMTQAQAAAAKAVIEGFIANHIRGPKTGIMLDSKTYETTDERSAPSAQRLWDIDLLKSGGTSHAQINEAIKRRTFELAVLLGCEHLMIGADGGGSLALHGSSTRRLHGMVNSCLGEVVESEQRQIVKAISMLNNIPEKLRPRLKVEKIAYRTVEEVTGALSAMATAGAPIMPDDPAIGEVRDMVGLSRPEVAGVIEAGLLEMGAGSPDDDPEGDDMGNNNAPKGQGGAKKPGKRSGDPKALLADLAAYIDANRVPA